jgi:hypothetical protein
VTLNTNIQIQIHWCTFCVNPLLQYYVLNPHRRGFDRMLFWSTSTYHPIKYQYWRYEYEFRSYWDVSDWFDIVRQLLSGYSSNNRTDYHDAIRILLTVMLNTNKKKFEDHYCIYIY